MAPTLASFAKLHPAHDSQRSQLFTFNIRMELLPMVAERSGPHRSSVRLCFPVSHLLRQNTLQTTTLNDAVLPGRDFVFPGEAKHEFNQRPIKKRETHI